MQRDWKDPRDGAEWLVTLTPFGSRVTRGSVTAAGRLTVSFHRPGRRPCWTAYELGRPVHQVSDQEMMDLLDEALGSDAWGRVGAVTARGRAMGGATGGVHAPT